VVCTCADVEASAREAGAAAELAVTGKMAKYSDLSDQYTFYPVSVETLGPFNEMAYELVDDLGSHIATFSGDDRESSFLFQRLSVVVKRFIQFCCTILSWFMITRISGLSSLMLFL